jgi:hypothetical protein
LLFGYLSLLVACGDENLRHWPSIKAENGAVLAVKCAFGCENWEGFKSDEAPQTEWLVKTINLEGSSLETLKQIRLSDRCATTPNVIIEISTDTGFRQKWYIAVGPNDLPTDMCTFGRNQAEQTKFDAFFRKYIVGLE